MLPESFLSPLNLPFNQKCLDGHFELLPPDADPGVSGYWVLLAGGDMALVDKGGELYLPSGDLPSGIRTGRSLYFGQWQGRPCRVAPVDEVSAVPDAFNWRSMTAQNPPLPIELLSLGGLARQVLYWHDNSRFCSGCGQEQSWLAGEWGKACGGCGRHHFPHIHPCIIVAVRRPGEILLTRKAGWPEGRYSLVAGFLEMGECLEEAVAREVLEETGVRVDNVRYVGSQNWPFPCQLMTGFVADYVDGEVRIEEKELEDVRWFPVDDLPKLPPKRSISRYLIDHFKKLD